MSEPIVFISHFRIKEGKLDRFKEFSRAGTTALEGEKPQTLAFLMYLDAEERRASVVHLFADSQAMDLHFEGAQQRAAAAYELMVPDGWEIYGAPSRAALETMRQAAASAAVGLTVQPAYVSGFLRAG
jgi:hypothetical protein